jgi:hypothetical protein
MQATSREQAALTMEDLLSSEIPVFTVFNITEDSI